MCVYVCVYVSVYRCMGGWYGWMCMGVWVYGCMGVWVWVYVCMCVSVYVCMGVWVYGCMGVWHCWTVAARLSPNITDHLTHDLTVNIINLLR